DNLLFIGTASNGIRGWDMTNPVSPVALTIKQLPFAVTRLTSTAGRVLVQGPASGGLLSLAWIDRPIAKSTNVGVQTVGAGFTSAISAIYPSSDHGFF